MRDKFILVLCSFCLLSFEITYAEETFSNELIPREVLFGNPEKASPLISPDGSKLAYLAPDEKDVLNVWVKDLSGKNEDVLITSSKKRGVPTFFWEYDNNHILYLQDQNGDENWHLYQTNLTTKLTRDLTPFEGALAKVLAYSSKFPKELLVELNIRNPTFFDVYRLNLQNGALEMEVKNVANIASFAADHNLQVRASSFFNEEGGTVIQVKEDKASPWKVLIEWSVENSGELIGFSPNNQSLYITTDLETKTQALIEINIKTGEKKTLVQDQKYDLSSEVLLHPVSDSLEAIGVFKERFEWVVLDPTMKQELDHLQKKKEEVRILNRDLQNKNWVVAYSSDEHPNHFYLYNRETKENTFWFSSNSKIEKYSLSKMMPISFKARDGMELQGYMTLPVRKDPKNLPTILVVHGGPWARDTWGYNPSVQWLANRGYAILQINYRGSTGYGKEYLNAGNKEWAGKMHTDLLDGKEWMVGNGYTDKNKVAIFGGSYGGYATLVGLAFTPKEFCCGVDFVGPSSLVTLIETIPPYWKYFRATLGVRIGSLETEKEFLESRSPLFKVDQICRPLLIAQGANDPRVKQSESDQIVEAMRKNGKEVEYILFTDEGHGFKRPENRLKVMAAAEEFFNKFLNESN